jgi:DNA-binding PadR family transcriptional regulator
VGVVEPSELHGFGRYADPALVIMTSLAEGPKHGYAIVKDVEAMGGPTLRPGTLYSALVRLEQRGLVEALTAQGRRRPYRLTTTGATALATHLTHVARIVRVGQARLGLA